MKRLILILATVAVTGAAGFYGSGFLLDRTLPSEAKSNGRGDGPAKVELARVETKPVRQVAEAVGSTRAVQSIALKPAADGRIVSIHFDTGAEVRQGDLLVQLDDRAEIAALKEAEATLAEARNNLERAQALSRQNVSSEAAVDALNAQLLRAEALREQAANSLADRRVVAPFVGTVGLNALDVGERVTTADVITSLDDLTRIEVTFGLPEAYFSRTRLGQRVVARNDAYSERRFEGEVTAIDPRIDAASRAFQVRATLPNDDRSLATGMFLGVELVIEERDALTVPEVALMNEGDKLYVFTTEDRKAKRREVEVGLRSGSDVEIRNGLDAEAQVVTSGLQRIRDGVPIEAVDAVADKAPAAAEKPLG